MMSQEHCFLGAVAAGAEVVVNKNAVQNYNKHSRVII